MSLQHILKNSSVSGKEPLASQLANGELSINYHADGPFLCCKDTAGNVRRVAGVWVSATAPSTPFPGELWLDTGISPSQLKVYKDPTDAWVFAGEVNTATTTTEGIVRLATNAEAQGGTSTTSAVTPAALQSKISDSTSSTSSTTIASSTAVKAVADTVGAALPKSGGTITGILEIGNAGQLRFEGSSNDAFETTLAVEDPTATRTITLPDRSGTVITTGDTGTVTSTMIADGTIVNADINASAAIADTKLATINTAGKVSNSATTATSANTASAIVARDGSGNFSAGTITANLTGNVTGNLTGTASAIADNTVTSAKIVDGTITDADINANAEIAVSKLADGTTRQLLQTDAAGTGVEWTSNVDIPGTLDVTGATTLDSTLSVPLGSAAAPPIYPGADTNTGIYSPGADQVAISTNGTGRLFIDSSGRLLVGTSTTLGQDELVQIVKSNAGDHLGIFSFDATAGGQPAEINLSRSRSDTKGTGVALAADDSIGAINFRGYDGDNYSLAARIVAEADGEFNTSGDTTDSPGRLVFSTTADGASSTTERMRIDSNGTISTEQALGITTVFSIRNTTNTGSQTLLRLQGGTYTLTDTTSKLIQFRRNDGTEIGSVIRNGTSTVNYATSSDYRLKENVQPLTDALALLSTLKPSRFNFIGDTRTVNGFIAHEVQVVVPECVTGEKDAVDDEGKPIYQGIDQSKLVPLLTAALQEAVAKIETLEARVAALEAA